MKAVRLFRPGNPLELSEIPIPTPVENDVLVRVKAAGICHSDAHYRAGRSRVEPLPLTLGHEVAGVVEKVGAGVREFKAGDRVCVHYLATCGHCHYCEQGSEQFCSSGKMIGKYRDGGYAEYLLMPARSLLLLPTEIPFEQGAIMMCSSATSLHALNKARLKPGETVAIFGAGGLGLSAIQLARNFGARTIFAIDINPGNLELAEKFEAIPINASKKSPVQEILARNEGQGVDVALELIGLPATMRQAVQCVGIKGRAALVGITEETFPVSPYHEILNKEAEIIGVSDHLASELPLLIEWTRTGKLDLRGVVTRTIALEARAINETLDGFKKFKGQGRTVILL
jgi:D-arabinose 1-dehydrogenase-like Zn-dependent alcohol dehydrogenase